ncbi:MAG: isochorismatase [Actinomycetota bacterium]|nr:isochorismatase [Actinomycetota bacterium]
MSTIQTHGTYEARPIRFQELWEPNGWRIKVYGIAHGRPAPHDRLIRGLKKAAEETLPQPAVTRSRYGLGFICAHQGRTVSIGFVDWWENEDELHHKMFIADDHDLSQLRPAGEDELTACSWDLAVMGFERNAWVRDVLQAPKPDIQGYLNAHLNEDI